jgi:hypothetical protein
MFGSRINVYHGGMLIYCPCCRFEGTDWLVIPTDEQNWYYIKQQGPDEILLLKIYDSGSIPGKAQYTPHSGVDDLHGVDGPENSRESIEVRLVACYA